MRYLLIVIVGLGTIILTSCRTNEKTKQDDLNQEKLPEFDLSKAKRRVQGDDYYPGKTLGVKDSIIHIIGTWEGDWYMGDRIVIAKKSNGKFYRINYYQDSSYHEHELKVVDTNGVHSYINLDEESLEYYRVEPNGELGHYSAYIRFKTTPVKNKR